MRKPSFAIYHLRQRDAAMFHSPSWQASRMCLTSGCTNSAIRFASSMASAATALPNAQRKLPNSCLPDQIRSPRSPRHSSTQNYFAQFSWLDQVQDLKFSFESSIGKAEIQAECLKSPDLSFKLSPFSMRDSCSCKECRHPITKQRQFDTFSMPDDLQPQAFNVEDNQLKVQWSDGHNSLHSRQWLQSRIRPLDARYIWPARFRQWFDPSSESEPPSVPFDEIMRTDKGLKTYLNLLGEYGFCFVDDCPTNPDATRRLLERVSFIRLTHYGGFYDFTSDLSLKDTAYTNIALEPHTDNTYFTDPTGLQMLHLLSHTEGGGGLSTLVDGFEVADALRKDNSSAYKILANSRILAHASGNDDIGSITPTGTYCTVIQETEGHLSKIRWNNSDRSSFVSTGGTEKVTEWYMAAKQFNALVNSKRYLYEFQLKPGRPLLFDNWRMMHGRTAFTGKRRMAGGYINMDDFVAKWKQLNLGNEQILDSV